MQESFEDLLDSTEAAIKDKFPKMSDESVTRMAVTMLGMSMVYSDESADAVQVRTLMHLSVCAANGVPWAKDLARELDASVQESIAKAEKAGIDPVSVVMANHELTRNLAYSAIARVRSGK